MKRRSFFAIAFSTTVATSLLASCSGGQAGSDTASTPGATEASPAAELKTLIMATSADYPPYESVDTATSQIVGFDVDIANYIGEKLGYKVEIKSQNFDGLISALQAKRADFVMAGMTPTEERQKNADFSLIYYDAKNTLVAKQGSNYTKLEDLAGKKLGVQLGSIQEGEANKAVKDNKVADLQIVPLTQIQELIQSIKTGRIDAAIIEDTVAKGYTDTNTDLEFNVIPSDGPSGSAIAFPKGSPLVTDFNRVLEEMKANGEMEKLVKKWFDAQAATPAPSPS